MRYLVFVDAGNFLGNVFDTNNLADAYVFASYYKANETFVEIIDTETGRRI